VTRPVKKPSVYIASPLGFSKENVRYLVRVRHRITELGLDYFDPWLLDYRSDIKQLGNPGSKGFSKAQEALATKIGTNNREAISRSDYLLAICDGPQVDDGTASEIGFAAGIGVKVHGLRTDFRNVGDLPALPINLQVLYFIKCTGGQLFRSVEAIVIR